MKKMLFLLIFLLAVTPLTGCIESSDDGNSPTAPTPTATNLSGTWIGSGTYYIRDDGRGLNMAFDLTLNLTHNPQTGAVGGSFSVTRPVAGTRGGSVNGTAAGGSINLNMPSNFSIEGTYTGTTMTYEMTERTSPPASWKWAKARGTATKQ